MVGRVEALGSPARVYSVYYIRFLCESPINFDNDRGGFTSKIGLGLMMQHNLVFQSDFIHVQTYLTICLSAP